MNKRKTPPYRIVHTIDTAPPNAAVSFRPLDTTFFSVASPDVNSPPKKAKVENDQKVDSPTSTLKQLTTMNTVDAELQDVITIVKLHAEILHQSFMRANERRIVKQTENLNAMKKIEETTERVRLRTAPIQDSMESVRIEDPPDLHAPLDPYVRGLASDFTIVSRQNLPDPHAPLDQFPITPPDLHAPLEADSTTRMCIGHYRTIPARSDWMMSGKISTLPPWS